MSNPFPSHLGTFDYRGYHRYFITWCCHDRQRLFSEQLTVDLVWTQIQRASADCEMAIPAYVFMPEHLHCVVEGIAPTSDGKRFFSLAKQFSGYAHSKTRSERLWQRYGYEHVLRSDETTRRVVRYVISRTLFVQAS